MRREARAQPEKLRAVADRQHGMVSARQLKELGVGIESRWLHRVHRGVYAVGHVPRTAHARFMAAVLATACVLSHRSAAHLWGFWPHDHGFVDVLGTTRGADRRGIQRHWTRSLEDHEVVTLHGIPVTTARRTAADLARVAAPEPYELALRSAERMRLLDRRDLGRTEPLRSQLESAFRALLNRARLPRPEFNAIVEGRERDCVWRRHRLVVELDGYADHRSREAFRTDRERDAELTVAGWRVVRFTYHQVMEDPAYVVATLCALLR